MNVILAALLFAGAALWSIAGVMAIPDFTLETQAFVKGMVACGVDEAGRGPWAGPVVAAAVILDAARIPAGLNDSKKLSEAKREVLHAAIMETAQVGIGFATAAVIDKVNILQATYLAMAEAVQRLSPLPALALVDGNRAPPLRIPVKTVIGGDGRSLSIAAASIIAKVTRDRVMRELDQQHPGYGFARHKGYGTTSHMEALQRLGPCPEHRKSFAPIAALTIG